MTTLESKADKDATVVRIAEIVASKAPARLRTVLGSCIGVALYDRRAGIGGLAHVMLPDSRGEVKMPGKFADTAIPALVEKLTQAGAGKLSAKIAGGANML